MEFNSKTHRTSDWYRIQIKDSCTFNFKINPINKRDSFDLSFYRYSKGDDFCADLYEKKLKSEKKYIYKNIKKQETASLSEITVNAEKDIVYYLCISSTTINNCGHQLRLNIGKDTLIMQSIFFPCTRDTSSLAIGKIKGIQSQSKNEAVKKSEIDKSMLLSTSLGDAKSTPLINVKCAVIDGDRNFRLESKLKLIDELTGREMKVEMKKTGEFDLSIEPNKKYKVECSSLGYKFFDFSVNISKSLNSDKWYVINLVPLKAGNNFVMKNIYFHSNTYALKKESQEELNALLEYLNANPRIKIEIQGYTNGNQGIKKNKAYAKLGKEWNFEGSAKSLSKHRAEAIKKYLLTQGIVSNRIVTKGFGGEKMIIKNPKTMDEIQKNIRVEVLIIEN